MGLGGAVRRLREQAGLSQGELAAKAGVSQAEISRIERGRTQYSRAMPELAKALGCQVADLSPEYASAGRDTNLPSIPIVEWVDLVGDWSVAPPKGHIQLSMLDGRFVIAAVMPDGSADRIAAEGDTVFVDTADIDLRHGESYLFVHEGAPVIRIYRKLPDRMQPASTNLDFETQYCTASTRVIGRVRLAVKVL